MNSGDYANGADGYVPYTTGLIPDIDMNSE